MYRPIWVASNSNSKLYYLPKTFWDPVNAQSTPHRSIKNGTPPILATVSTIDKHPNWLHRDAIPSTSSKTPVELSPCATYKTLGEDSCKTKRRSSRSTPAPRYFGWTAFENAPSLCTMFAQRWPQIPDEMTQTTSSGSTKLVSAHSIPECPVPARAKVTSFLVWKRYRIPSWKESVNSSTDFQLESVYKYDRSFKHRGVQNFCLHHARVI